MRDNGVSGHNGRCSGWSGHEFASTAMMLAKRIVRACFWHVQNCMVGWHVFECMHVSPGNMMPCNRAKHHHDPHISSQAVWALCELSHMHPCLRYGFIGDFVSVEPRWHEPQGHLLPAMSHSWRDPRKLFTGVVHLSPGWWAPTGVTGNLL